MTTIQIIAWGGKMRDYGKVHSSFWTSLTVRTMSEDARTLAMYLLTSPHGTIAGVFRLPDGYVCEDLQWDSKRVCKGFAELFGKGFANRCDTTKWVWITRHLVWNKLENPNQKKSAQKIAQSIPDQCAWKQDYMRDSADIMDMEYEPLRNPSETVPQPVTVAVTEAVTVTEDSNNIGKKTANALPCPYDQLINLYRQHMPENPGIIKLNDERRKIIRERWNEASKGIGPLFGYSTVEEGLQKWEQYFKICSTSDFLTGKAKPMKDGNKPFVADIEFLFNKSKFLKILENKYH